MTFKKKILSKKIDFVVIFVSGKKREKREFFVIVVVVVVVVFVCVLERFCLLSCGCSEKTDFVLYVCV